jgi:hypothetical protein
MTEPVKVIAPMATPSAHLDQRLAVDVADRADAEALRRIDGGRRHHDGGKADQRVEGGDELRHRGHGDAPRDDRADAAADGEAERRSGRSRRPTGVASASVVRMAIAMPIMP